MLTPEPDDLELALIEATLDRTPEASDGKTYWRIKRFLWDKGKDTGLGYPSPGVQNAVDVEIAMGSVTGAVVSCKPMKCVTFEKDAMVGIEHRNHDDGCRWVLNGMGPVRAWYFLDVRDAILAAMRWDPDDEAEPFGWTRALDGTGRIRPNGDPMREMIGGEAVVQ